MGPTRAALQSECVVEPVSEGQKLRGYFHAARQLLLQGETYYAEGVLVYVRKNVWVLVLCSCCGVKIKIVLRPYEALRDVGAFVG